LQENGPRTVADATAWRAESGVGWAAVDGRWRENGACLICPLGDADACQFRRAPTPLCWPGVEETEQSGGRFGFTGTALALYTRTVFSHLISIGQ
jgi:hypothetical protein